MVDIGKAQRIQEKEVRTQLDRMEILDALRHGNIYEVFAKSKDFKISDFHEFFSDQWKSWKGQVIQDAEIKAVEGSYHEPDLTQFSVHHRAAALSPEEGKELGQSMSNFLGKKGAKFKGQVIDDKKLTEGSKAPTKEGLEDAVNTTLDEWESFMSDTWEQIMDAQMMSDYKSRMGEIQQEVQRIISLAKQGAIGPEFVLLALAKVNATKNGVLFSWLGKKASHVNESINKIANDLHTLSPTDPRYAGELQLGQSKTRDKSFQLQLLQTDMQKIMQDMAGTLEAVHGMMGEINRTRREIITKVAAH